MVHEADICRSSIKLSIGCRTGSQALIDKSLSTLSFLRLGMTRRRDSADEESRDNRDVQDDRLAVDLTVNSRDSFGDLLCYTGVVARGL